MHAPRKAAQDRAARAAARADRVRGPGGFVDRFEAIAANVERVVKGKGEVVRLALTALVAEGHVLFEDVPGTGKTVLARAIARSIGAESARIQCTPDLLPADITGSPVLDRRTGNFVFRPGPVFANVLLCDEVNRATPKTQSALLEAMQERTVTVDGVTHSLPVPFYVLATENPVELAGTFQLPEAQLDRFLFRLSLGYLDRQTESDMVAAQLAGADVESIAPVIAIDEIREMAQQAAAVEVPEPVRLYTVDLVQSTRSDGAVQLGASARATLALARAGRVLAAAQGRGHVLPDDIRVLAPPVLAHRLTLTPDAVLRGETPDQVVGRLVARVKPPLGFQGR